MDYSDTTKHTNGMAATNPVPFVVCKALSKVYQGKQGPVYALDGIDISIAKGEILALLGVNGAGKTTLSSLLATVHPATSGTILFQGASVYDQLALYRASMGYCPQHPNLDPFLTVRENLVFAGRYFLMESDVIEERVRMVLNQFALEKYADASIHVLSGGYKQRLSLARSLMHRPSFIILDEPTVGLDPHIRRQLWDIIRGLKQQGITVVLTTHYLDEAEALSDRACILHRGKILLTESIDSLKEKHKKDRFEDVFIDLLEAQAKYE